LKGLKIITRDFTSWNAYKDFVNHLSDSWVFRGQTDAKWSLKTSFERTDFFDAFDHVETNFLAEFQRGARNFLEKEETPNSLTEWLALIQHHGAPSRLLDFTKSPFIAAYFAFEDIQYETDESAIWALDSCSIRSVAMEYLSKKYKKEMEKYSNQIIPDEIMVRLFLDNDKSCVFPIEPFTMNKRYYLQQSTFFSTANTQETFMEQLDFLKDNIKNSVIKLVVSSKLKREILMDLDKMNINRATLFPSLDGYSKSLKMRFNLRKSHVEELNKRMQESEFLKMK
jgi:hypothetical protein